MKKTISVQIVVTVSLLIIFSSCAAMATESFWIQDGMLNLEIVKPYAYLYNERGNSKYFYELKGDIYTPRAVKKADDVLRFKIMGMIPEVSEISGYRMKERNRLDRLIFSGSRTHWKVRKEDERYILYEVSQDIREADVARTVSEKERTVASVRGPKFMRTEKLPFEEKFKRKIEDVKPNFQIDLGKKMDLIREITRLTNTGKSRSDIETKKKEFLSFITQEISPYIEEERTSITEVNKIDEEPFDILKSLYESFLEMDNHAQQFNLSRYQKKYTLLLDLLQKLRDFRGDMQRIKSEIGGFKNNISLSKKKIKNLRDSIEDKRKIKIAQKKIYQSNIEAHAEYGLYVYRFQYKGHRKSFLDHNKEIERLAIVQAIEDLSEIFIRNETRLEYDGETGKSHLNDWIEQIRGGYISINPTKDDVIPFSSKGRKIFFVIKYVKYLPKENSLPQEDETVFQDQEQIGKYYKFYPILDERQLQEFIAQISQDNGIQDKVEKLIRRKYGKMAEDRDNVAKMRGEAFGRFIHQISRIDNDISAYKETIRESERNIQNNFKRIEDVYTKAKNIYEGSQGGPSDICRKIAVTTEEAPSQNIRDVSTCQKCVEAMTGELIKMINESFRFHLNGFGNAFLQKGQTSPQHIAQLVFDTFFSLDSRYQLVSETIKTTVENGIFVERTEKTFELTKKYSTLSVYLDDASVINNNFIAYVVLRLNTEVTPGEFLKAKQFETLKRGLDGVWSGIQEEYNDLSETTTTSSSTTTTIAATTTIMPYDTTSIPPTPATIITTTTVLPVCQHCYEIGARTFSFKYFDDLDLYEKIEYNETTPQSIARNLDDDGKRWQLPTSDDVRALIAYIRSNRGQLSWDIRGKNIYISGDSPKRTMFPALHVSQNYDCSKKFLDPGDAAYLIFVAR